MAERKVGDWLTGYLEFCDNQEPPELFKTWTGISAICSVLQRKCWMVFESQIYPNMYIVLVGPSASRKGTAMRPARKLLKNLGINMAAEAITREALIRELGNSVQQDMYKDTTLDHCSLTIFSEELTVFLGQNNWQLISDLNNWYDCLDDWTYRTKHQGEDIIDNVWVNLIGATTPEFLRSALPNDAIGGGLVSRIVFVFGDNAKIVPAPFITPELQELFELLQHDLSVIAGLTGEFKMTEEYFSLHHDWYIETRKNPPFDDEELLGYNGRRSLHLRKLTIALSASRGSDMLLTEEDFKRAEQILTTTEKHMHFCFSGRGRHPGAWVLDQLIKYVEGSKERETGKPIPVPYVRILEKFYKDATPDELKTYLSTYRSMGLVKFGKKEVNGKEMLYVVYSGGDA